VNLWNFFDLGLHVKSENPTYPTANKNLKNDSSIRYYETHNQKMHLQYTKPVIIKQSKYNCCVKVCGNLFGCGDFVIALVYSIFEFIGREPFDTIGKRLSEDIGITLVVLLVIGVILCIMGIDWGAHRILSKYVY
jgi:hypothetical protein